MENCSIYSHHLHFDKVVSIIKSTLPKAKVEFNDGGKQKSLVATIKGGLFGKTKSLTMNYRERENPSYKLDQIECGLTQNLAGMVNFIQSIPAQNIELRNKFLHKVMSANCEMSFMAEPEITNEFENALRKIADELDAFIFAQPSKTLSKSNGQHFLDNQLNLIIDSNGNCEVSDVSVSVDAKYHDEPASSYTEDQLTRKANSETLLTSKGIQVNTNLPCVSAEANTKIRAIEEVIDRVYALMIVAVRGEGVNQEQVKKPIEEKVINSFSPKEQIIISTAELNDQQKSIATWRYESLYTLLWALQLMPDLKYPSDICDVKSIVSKIIKPSRAEFTEQCKLRTDKEILDALDSVYRMNWACVNARVKGEEVGGNINPSVLYERHYALNWLTSYQNQEWDEVKTNT